MTRPELLDKITVLLGGRAAEQLVFGEVSTGAQDDLERATDLARRMVAQFGMSTALGPQSARRPAVAPRRASCRRRCAERGYSERTQQPDRQRGERAPAPRVRSRDALLEHNRAQLLALAARLREKEVLEGDELRAALEGAEAPPSLQGADEHQWSPLPH